MTGIKQLAAKLRRAADVLEDLFIDSSNETKTTAEKILRPWAAEQKKVRRKSWWTPAMRAAASRRLKKRLRAGNGKLKVAK